MTREELLNKLWEEEGDDHLFPNHTDKDIWIKGFDAGWKACEEYYTHHKQLKIKTSVDRNKGWGGC